MEFMVVNPGFKVEDITPLENILSMADPFVKHPLPPVDKYDLTSYIFASHALKKELYALLDNNLATRVIELATGMEMPGEAEKKPAYVLASAVMGFLIASEFLIDPTMSIYEKAASLGHEAAVDQLFRFRVADHVHPQAWIDLALERTNRITRDEIELATDYVIKDAPEIEEKNFGKTLDMWKLNYYSVLKAASLWRKESRDVVAACDFIYWMEDESFFNGIAGIFTLVLFSPKRYGKMIKGINSVSKIKLLGGLKNAAWDMTYIRYWSKSCKDADETSFGSYAQTISLFVVLRHTFSKIRNSERDTFYKHYRVTGDKTKRSRY